MNCTECYPHGLDDPCTCDGCWACDGHVQGCTCDINWDCGHDRLEWERRTRRPQRPTLYDQDAQRRAEGVVLSRAQAAAIAGLLADVLARNGSPYVGQIREALAVLTPHPSTLGPSGGTT